MGHQETEVNISPAEKQFRQIMQNGDDFFKIEIWRSAVKQYKSAATLDVDNDLANRKVAECEHLLVKERKVIYVVVAIAAVAAVLVWLI